MSLRWRTTDSDGRCKEIWKTTEKGWSTEVVLFYNNGSELCVINGSLYTKNQILDQPVSLCHLVLPKERRIKMVELEHESVCGEQDRQEKTIERTVWRKMGRDIVNFYKSCKKCKLEARSFVTDRVPIKQIPKRRGSLQRNYYEHCRTNRSGFDCR